MFIPTEALKRGNFEKAARQRSQKRIFKDKTVDTRNSPLLFNIETGIEEMSHVSNGVNISRAKVQPDLRSSDRGWRAREMLLHSNIGYVPQERNYSLLRKMSNKPGLKSKNIMDTQQFKQTRNEYIQATTHFPNERDTFYELDDNAQTANARLAEVDTSGKAIKIPDLSLLAAGITVTNMSKNYVGKSKYFTKTQVRRRA